MIIHLDDPDKDLYVCILASILEKIEGKIFVKESKVIELPCDTQIRIHFDEEKRGWWVTLEGGENGDPLDGRLSEDRFPASGHRA